MPELSLGKREEASIILPPDIGEHVELARRLNEFFDTARYNGVQPSQQDRDYKNIRMKQPSGTANLGVMFTRDATGRLASEIRVKHDTPQTQVHYTLLGSQDMWQRNQYFSKPPRQVGNLDPADFMKDMEEYFPDNIFEDLQDKAPTAHDIVMALSNAVALRARYKHGTDYYRSTTPLKGNTSVRHIELGDTRVNRKTKQVLAVSAFSELEVSGPIDVCKTISYEVERDHKNKIQADAIRLGLSSRDGLTETRLRALLNPNDTKFSPVQILHGALNEVEQTHLT